MPRRYTNFSQDHYYHIFNRGADKQKIFYEQENYSYFLRLLKPLVKHYNFNMIVYCLMPNHFHFLIKLNENLNVGSFMSRFLDSYVTAFNNRYNRSGFLFKERYKSILVEKEEYLKYLCRYIHRNPLKANLVNKIEQWPWSNYFECVGERTGCLCDKNFIISCFSSQKQYKEFVLDNDDSYPDDFDKFIFE